MIEKFIITTLLILWAEKQLEPTPVVVPTIEEGVKAVEVREVPKDAVNVAEVMALKEVLEKVVDLQKKEGEQ
jgi:hypothetical protein